jgi:hypothetical protein
MKPYISINQRINNEPYQSDHEPPWKGKNKKNAGTATLQIAP